MVGFNLRETLCGLRELEITVKTKQTVLGYTCFGGVKLKRG